MTPAWPYRPNLRHLGLFFIAYVLGCGFAQALAIVPGTGISIWPPSGLFIATLILAPMRSWPWWVLAGCFAELLSNVLWFHSPFPAAVLIYAGNALEAMLGAWLVNWALNRSVRLETLHEVITFIVLCAGIAPVVSATIGSATLAWFGIYSQTFTGAWPLFWIGDATGVLIVAPLALLVFQDWRDKTEFSPARWAEASVLGLIFLGIAVLSLSGYLPFAYIIMPPLLWAAVRFEFKGAVVTLALLALLAAVFTISGAGQFVGDPETQRHRQIMLQLFLVISAFSALIVAAISRQHQLALSTLRESERSLRELVETLPARIWCTTPTGEPFYFSKQLREFYGFNMDEKDQADHARLSNILAATIHPDDLEVAGTLFAKSLATGEPYMVRHRQRLFDGTYRWVQTHATAMRGANGEITRWNGINFDIHDLVIAQEALRDRERELSQLINMVPAQIRRLTPEGQPTFFNKRLLDFFGVDSLTQLDNPDRSRLATAMHTYVHPEDSTRLLDAVRHSVATGKPNAMKYRMLRADGVYRWVDGRWEPSRDDDGTIVEWFAISIDIDDEVKAEEALRTREREFSQLVNMVPSYLWRLTPDGVPNFFNQRLIDFLGLDLGDVDVEGVHPLAAIIQAAVHPDDSTRMTQALFHSVGTGERFSMKYRLRRADGVYRWVEGSAEPMLDDDGRIVQWYGLSHDIDDLVQAEEALRNSKQQLEQMIDAVPFSILSFAPSGRMTYVSKRYQEQAGTPMAQIEDFDMLARDVAHPQDFPAMFAKAKNGFATGQPFVNRFRRRLMNGGYRWIEARAQPLRDANGAVVQWYIASIDIEDEMNAQEALRNREREFSQLVAMVPSLLWRLSPDGEPTFFNKRLMDFFGVGMAKADELDAHQMAAIIEAAIHPDDAAGWAEALKYSVNTGERFSRRYRLRRADGAYRWVEGSAEPLRDESGRIVQWYGLSHDVDDQLRAEETLRESEKQLRRLVDALPTLIWAAEPDGEPSYLNRRLAEYVGLTLADLNSPDASRLQMAIQNSVHPDDAASVGHALVHSFATGETFAMKYRQRRADGVYRWINGRAEPLRDASGYVLQWYGVSFDIDDDVRTQEELRRTQERLAVASQAASLAELSASIAHEVNQPLAAIVANSHACHRWLSVDPPNVARAKIVAERIIRDANAAADVVGRVRALFRQSVEARISTTLAGVIAEAGSLMAEEAARRRIRMDIYIESNLPPVTLDVIQIQQVLINLIRNGMEAMDPTTGEKILEVRAHRAGNEIQTEISDHGRGIEFPDRIFEPFFTTKGTGMGMGLAICRSIVESHGGRLWAENNEPNGARFIFILPITAKAAP
ncbi:PAS domain S-box protein [Neorhizobium sp. P12A]|uniref:PAS domain-containing protein n=1 Tax=Rhizobium/Agrobacterium group TaxID=227290 RepID=UPI0010456E61|nr:MULTISPECIES: PAS domain-containing protein [Rhizobium/Agrobacterium group]KAA0697854.1 PAS domain S-box protein [Neorhizobium sp. P12A]TCR87942.1 PAS domain S-box-containing protein [Rhizobium sp. BK376]